MKVTILLATAAAVAATTATNCVIPAEYVTVTGTACSGPATGYLVSGYCATGVDRATNPAAVAAQVFVPLTAANANSFTAAGASTRPGCTVPPLSANWNTAGANTIAPLTAAPACGALALPLNTGATPIKGADVRCDAANGYFPIRGFEGALFCNDRGLNLLFAAAVPAQTTDYFMSPAAFDAIPTTLNAEGYTEFTGANQLLCGQGCLLPTTLCNNNVPAAGVIFDSTALLGTGANACRLRPTVGTTPLTLTFTCLGGGANVFALTCNTAVGSTTSTLAGNGLNYNGRCGPTDGAISFPIWNKDGELDRFNTVIRQDAGEIVNFPLVTSTLQKAYDVPNGAYATAWLRHWNDNPAQNLQNGAVYTIIVTGCTGTEVVRRQCVQQTLNWWRCKYDFPFNGGTLCFSNAVVIACPTHQLGFRCPSSSKKGLLGLLGLLGLIPLFLLCCCLLFLCCIRRRKTEADVHFATFDPHAAPVIATAPCATATACPTAFGATPFATHPSAMPCL